MIAALSLVATGCDTPVVPERPSPSSIRWTRRPMQPAERFVEPWKALAQAQSLAGANALLAEASFRAVGPDGRADIYDRNGLNQPASFAFYVPAARGEEVAGSRRLYSRIEIFMVTQSLEAKGAKERGPFIHIGVSEPKMLLARSALPQPKLTIGQLVRVATDADPNVANGKLSIGYDNSGYSIYSSKWIHPMRIDFDGQPMDER